MSAKTTHYNDVLPWLEKVVHSCNTKEQVDNAEKLIGFYDKSDIRKKYIKVIEVVDRISNLFDQIEDIKKLYD